MIIAAIVIGAITAYYFGLRVGGIAAVGSFGLFVLGVFMPSKILWTYGLVGGYTLGVLVVGPHVPGRKESKANFLRMARKGGGKVLKLFRKFSK